VHIWPGSPFPLGATYDGGGTNFAIFSEVAHRIELCLISEDGTDAGTETRLELPERDGLIWHGYLPRIGPGQRYGYRVHGPYEPGHGPRCNPAKLLLDPYAKAIDGNIEWDEAMFGYHFGDPDSFNDADSGAFTMKSVVVNPFFDWAHDRPPRIPYHQTVIYEAHVKGMTMSHPDVPEDVRGSYAGIAHPVMLAHLKRLGVTAIERMRCTSSSTTPPWSTRACRTTGATTRSGSSPRTTVTPASAPAASRCRSSRRWSARCTAPASR